MDAKINDVNEMIEHNRVYDHEELEEGNKNGSNRSSPILDSKKKPRNNSRENCDDNDDCNDNASENNINDNIKDQCGVVNNSNSRTMNDELSLKEKEVC